MANSSKDQIRQRIHTRIRRKLAGTTERPRLAVFRSLKHIYAQVIDDTQGRTVASASSDEKNGVNGGNVAGARPVGKLVAAAGQGKRREGRGVRPRRLSVPWPRESAGRFGPCGRPRVLRNEFYETMSLTTAKRIDANTLNLKEQVVSINRVTKVVKGGKNLSFSALVVIGDPGAKIVGFGTGKAKEVPAAIKKGIEAAKKNLRKVNVLATTIQHVVLGEFGSGRVLLKPAPEGTGVIAGGPVRAVITAVGIPNVLTKSIGSHNPHNVVKATIDALEQLRDKGEVATLRGLDMGKVV